MKCSRRSLLGSAIAWPLSGLASGLPAQKAAAANRWPYEQTVGAAVFHANFDLARHANLVHETAQLQRDLNQSLQLGPVRESIHLFLFRTQSVYQQYLEHYLPHVPYRRALFVKRRGPGMVFAHLNPEFEIDVRHEATHAILHARLSQLPLWLDEGLAEYFEVPAGHRAGANPHLTALASQLQRGDLIPLQTLERIETLAQMGPEQYRCAWSWVHFLLHGPPAGRRLLPNYLGDLRHGVPAGPFSHRLRQQIPDLEARYLAHLQDWASS